MPPFFVLPLVFDHPGSEHLEKYLIIGKVKDK